MTRILATLMLSMAMSGAWSEPPDTGPSVFEFDEWAGPVIEVRLFVPDTPSPTTPVVIVMHGFSRDVERYFRDWRRAGEEGGFIVVVPYFSKEHFPNVREYNLGWVFDDAGEMRPSESWAFSAIEPIFDAVVERVGGSQRSYTLYGHSAGSQFVHRFLYYVPQARAKRVIAANAGWYTMPLAGVRFPYGLGESGVDRVAVAGALERDVVILLGDADTDAKGHNLRKAPDAELQGAHRFERGRTFYRVAASVAEEIGVEFGWRIEIVSGAEHSNAQMTPAAAALVE